MDVVLEFKGLSESSHALLQNFEKPAECRSSREKPYSRIIIQK
jgi:hypothetical protein